MPWLIFCTNWKGETEGLGLTQQMGKWGLEPKEEDDGFEQYAKREKVRTRSIYSRIGEPQ